MARVIHFEIPADDPERAVSFYRDALGWKIEKYPGPQDYWLITTGAEGEPGINGALTSRSAPVTVTTNTVDVPSWEEASRKIKAGGGKVLTPNGRARHWLDGLLPGHRGQHLRHYADRQNS